MTTARQAGHIPTWTLGDRLRKARESADLEQQELAELMGVSRSTVTNAEKGKHAVRRIVLNAWSMATGVPLAWLNGEMQGPAGPDTDGDGWAPRGSNPEPAVVRFAQFVPVWGATESDAA